MGLRKGIFKMQERVKLRKSLLSTTFLVEEREGRGGIINP